MDIVDERRNIIQQEAIDELVCNTHVIYMIEKGNIRQ